MPFKFVNSTLRDIQICAFRILFLVCRTSLFLPFYADSSPTVAGVQHDLRYSILNWTAKDSNSKPPAKVEFVEYANPTFGRPWGDWIIQEDTEITIRHDRYNICF